MNDSEDCGAMHKLATKESLVQSHDRNASHTRNGAALGGKMIKGIQMPLTCKIEQFYNDHGGNAVITGIDPPFLSRIYDNN